MYFFFFNDTATTEIYTLSLHDALPICSRLRSRRRSSTSGASSPYARPTASCASSASDFGLNSKKDSDVRTRDRKSTRLNSSHANISYAVFCLKKKKINFSHYNVKHYKS